MIFYEKVQWRDGPKELIEAGGEPDVFDDYRVSVVCCNGFVVAYNFVDEEHGERDAAQAITVGCETGEVACSCVHFVDEEGEEE